ncbi:MAG: metallophosphoesterase [Bacillota bacterium]|nr:metallophosphoesterase [Bacillota bacterium]
MKILHCADIHLGSSLTAHLDAERAKSRANELLNSFLDLFRFAKENDVSAILIAGDLFDADRGIQNIKKLVFQAMGQYPSISFFYLRGNHDTSLFVEELPSNVYCFDSSWKSYSLSNRVVITGTELDANTDYSALNLDSQKFNIVLLHGQVGESIPLSSFAHKNVDYLALGHVHSYQEFVLDSRGMACYCGCLEGRGFDEVGNHGFVLLDIDEASLSYSKEFISWAKREVFVQEVDVSSCSNSLDVLQACLQYSLEESSMVKFVLVGELNVEVSLDLSFIQQHLAQKYYFVKVEDQTRSVMDFSLFENDLSLKGEFIRKIQDSSFSEEEKMALIKTGLEAFL